jgi:hypothetical protein
MAFLDRSTLVVDAILTSKGRERLSSNSFEIEKFALGDDEIDYTMYNESNSNGPNYYGVQIENMPILEASPKADIALQYKLITLPPGTKETPVMDAGVPSAVTLTGENASVYIAPSTAGMGGEDEEYIFEISDDLVAELFVGSYKASASDDTTDAPADDPNLIVPEGAKGSFGAGLPNERIVFQLDTVFDALPNDVIRIQGNYWPQNNGEYLIEKIQAGGKGYSVVAFGSWANKQYRNFNYSIFRGFPAGVDFTPDEGETELPAGNKSKQTKGR